MSQIETLIRAALQDRGIPVSDEEIEALVAAYPVLRARLDTLYAVADARYELPAMSFEPDSSVAEW